LAGVPVVVDDQTAGFWSTADSLAPSRLDHLLARERLTSPSSGALLDASLAARALVIEELVEPRGVAQMRLRRRARSRKLHSLRRHLYPYQREGVDAFSPRAGSFSPTTWARQDDAGHRGVPRPLRVRARRARSRHRAREPELADEDVFHGSVLADETWIEVALPRGRGMTIVTHQPIAIDSANGTQISATP
jgi:hypothetical protein